MTIEEAVEDIVTRGVGELRKNAFGEESEDVKSMGWSREQVFFILKGLAKSDEVRRILCSTGSLLTTYGSEVAILRRAYRLPIQGR